jgi:hypothetical protein
MRLSRRAREASVAWVLTTKEPGHAVTVEDRTRRPDFAVHVALGELSAG